jgi:transposase-like protein
MREKTSLTVENLQNEEFSFASCLRNEVEMFLQQAIETECSMFLKKWDSLKDRREHQAIVRNGFYPKRTIRTGVGNVDVRIPRVRDRIHAGAEFHSTFLPPYLRRCRSFDVLIPLLYLERTLDKEWQVSSRDPRDLEHNIFLLVVMGENPQGERKVLRFESGFRDARDQWDELLNDMKDKGLLSPLLVIGREDLGFWPSIRTIFRLTRRQLCWKQKEKTIQEKLREEDQGLLKNRLRNIWQADNRKEAEKRFQTFFRSYTEKYPEVMASLEKDRDSLLEFYHFPAEHWHKIRDTSCVYLSGRDIVPPPWTGSHP